MRRRFSRSRHTDLFTVVDTFRQIDAVGVGIGCKASRAPNGVVDASLRGNAIQSRTPHRAGDVNKRLRKL